MAAFTFPPTPIDLETVVNPITGSTYQWRPEFSKWVLTRQAQTTVQDLVWEGDNPPDPVGDYKLWYSTDTLELYFYYCDQNGVCAWLPTSVPIQVLEDLNAFATQAELDIDQLQYKQQLLQNAVDQLYLEQQQGNYVKKEGGDSMQGPLVIQAQDPTQGRDTNKVQTLGVFSNSEGSALRLGTTRDRVYVGHNDLSINGPVKLQEVQEKNVGQGIKVSNELSMSSNQIKDLANATEDNDAVPYGQVKDELKDLKDQIIQDAAVGVFKWDTISSNVSPNPGCFFGKNGANNATEPFINNFRVSNQDINGANQDLSTWDVGDIITWTNSTNSAYQIRYRVQTVPTFQNGHYFFEVQYISQTNLFVQGNDFILTRQQFTNIDFDDLETTYLRLDGDNGPMQGDVNFGRHATTNVSSIDLISNGAYIKAAGNNMLRVYSGSLTSEGYAQVRVERPSKATRGFAIRGYEEGSDSMRDLLYSYHPDSPTGDVIIYRGRTSSDQAIQTKESVKALIANSGKDTWTYVSHSSVPPADGTFSFDTNTNTFYISGITKEGKALTDASSSFNEYSLVAPGTAYDETAGGVLRAFFKTSSFRVQSYGGKNYFRIVRGGYAKHSFSVNHDYSFKIAGII